MHLLLLLPLLLWKRRRRRPARRPVLLVHHRRLLQGLTSRGTCSHPLMRSRLLPHLLGGELRLLPVLRHRHELVRRGLGRRLHLPLLLRHLPLLLVCKLLRRTSRGMRPVGPRVRLRHTRHVGVRWPRGWRLLNVPWWGVRRVYAHVGRAAKPRRVSLCVLCMSTMAWGGLAMRAFDMLRPRSIRRRKPVLGRWCAGRVCIMLLFSRLGSLPSELGVLLASGCMLLFAFWFAVPDGSCWCSGRVAFGRRAVYLGGNLLFFTAPSATSGLTRCFAHEGGFRAARRGPWCARA
jgi:hypothetical protein